MPKPFEAAALLALLVTACRPPSSPEAVGVDVFREDGGTATSQSTAPGREKFAAASILRNSVNSTEAETYTQNSDGTADLRMGPASANDLMVDGGSCASWIYHSPSEPVNRDPGSSARPEFQLSMSPEGIWLWVKTKGAENGVFRVAAYYREDGGEPFGSRGTGRDGAKTSEFRFSHFSPEVSDRHVGWWKTGPIPFPQGTNGLVYKIGVWKR